MKITRKQLFGLLAIPVVAAGVGTAVYTTNQAHAAPQPAAAAQQEMVDTAGGSANEKVDTPEKAGAAESPSANEKTDTGTKDTNNVQSGAQN